MSVNVSTDFHSLNVSFERCDPHEVVESATDRALMTTGYAVLIFGSLVGNVLVIAVFYKRYHQLRTPVNFFIVNMAVSDLLIPVFVIPRQILKVYIGTNSWLIGGVMGDTLCKLLHFSDEVSITVSSQSMVFIAAERFWATVFPMRPPLITRRTCPRFICFTWLFSMTFFSYYFVVNKLVENNKVYTCIYTLPQIFDNWKDLWKIDRLSILIVFVITPFVLMTTFYTTIIVALHRQEMTSIHLSSEEQYRRAKKYKKITWMLLTVVALFFISWTPYYFSFFLQYYSLNLTLSCSAKIRLHLGILYLSYMYTAINPLIYYVFNRTYRQGFHELLCCSWACLRSFRQRTVERNNNQQNAYYRNVFHSEDLELQVVPTRMEYGMTVSPSLPQLSSSELSQNKEIRVVRSYSTSF